VRVVSESEFRERLRDVLAHARADDIGAVTGPGRSGAIAAVYASHLLHVPFIPQGRDCPAKLGRMLVIDTARLTGATLRKAARQYDNPLVLVCFEEPPRVAFWYESTKPQHYRHERIAA
jgi:hypothetical protein